VAGLGWVNFGVMRRTFSPDDSFHLPALENDDVFFVVITKQYRLSITVVFYLTDCAFGESGSMAAITPVRRRKDLSRHLVPGGFNERFLENRALTIRGLPPRFQNVIRDLGSEPVTRSRMLSNGISAPAPLQLFAGFDKA
jgi:hypothetical protein